MQKVKHLVIPVEVAKYALSESKEMPIHCFHVLKHITPGYTYMNRRQISLLSDYLDRSPRTIKRYLSYLEGMGWIQPDGSIYVIKSWKRIFSLMGFEYVAGVEANPLKIEHPQAFLAGVFIGRLANFQRYKRNSQGKGKSANLGYCASTQPGCSTFFPIADRAIASILEVSRSKANKLKKLANEYGYIKLRYNYYQYSIDGNLIQINRSDEALFRELFDDIGMKMRIDKAGRVFVQDADLVKPELRYKKSQNYA